MFIWNVNFYDYFIGNYEVLLIEFFYDVKEYICNVFIEFLVYFEREECDYF